MAALKPAASLLFLALLRTGQKSDQATESCLNGLSLEQLGNVELTSVSKEPVKVLRTPAERFEVNLAAAQRAGLNLSSKLVKLAVAVPRSP